MPYKLTREQINIVVNNGATALAKYCMAPGNNIHYLITGSSGGLDSAITLGINKKACQICASNGFDLFSVGVIMPCESTTESEKLGQEAIETFDAFLMRIDLSWAFSALYGTQDRLLNDGGPEMIFPTIEAQIKDILLNTMPEAVKNLEWSSRVAQGNIKARLRMIVLYHIARMLGGMVMSTDNLSEHWMGFWTICGDVGDFGVIQNILKGYELYDIARYLGVPQRIIDAIPDDGLGVASGGDEAQLGAPYDLLDIIMVSLIQNGFDPDGHMKQLEGLPEIMGVRSDVVSNIAGRSVKTSWKRRLPIVLTREQLGLPPVEEIEL